jgi:LysM domain
MFESGIDTEHAFGQDVDMSRTHVRRRRMTLTAAATVLLAVLLGPVGHALQAGAAVRGAEPVGSTVLVRPGDSLWTIARRVEPGVDPRALVAAISEVNDVAAAGLVPGQRLVVPEP